MAIVSVGKGYKDTSTYRVPMGMQMLTIFPWGYLEIYIKKLQIAIPFDTLDPLYTK